MKRIACAAALLAGLTCGAAHAQQPLAEPGDSQAVLAEPSSMTPELWLYLHELRRYEDPQLAVRQKAEQKAAQRRARMAALKWHGFNNQRPQASCGPFTDVYSPVWVGNGIHPYGWTGGPPRVSIQIDADGSRR